MSTKINSAGSAHAHSLVDSGKVNRGSWSLSADEENKMLGPNGDNWAEYGKWHLATHPDATKDTKAYYGYPFGKNGEVYRNALISAKGRAAQQGATEVANLCGTLLDKIDKKSDSENRVTNRVRPTFFAKAKGKEGEIYIYQDIGDGYFGGITPSDFADMLKQVGNVDTLHLYVNSPGGSVFDGVAIYNQLKRFPAQKIVHVDALAASIASVMCMAGDKIIMAPNSMMMIHRAWGMCIGNAEEMRKNADTMDLVDKTITDTYVARTKSPRDKIEQWMADETWMTAQDCVDRGFADAIDESAQPMDSAFPLLAKFKNTPERLRVAATKPNVLLAKMNARTNKFTRPAEQTQIGQPTAKTTAAEADNQSKDGVK